MYIGLFLIEGTIQVYLEYFSVFYIHFDYPYQDFVIIY